MANVTSIIQGNTSYPLANLAINLAKIGLGAWLTHRVCQHSQAPRWTPVAVAATASAVAWTDVHLSGHQQPLLKNGAVGLLRGSQMIALYLCVKNLHIPLAAAGAAPVVAELAHQGYGIYDEDDVSWVEFAQLLGLIPLHI